MVDIKLKKNPLSLQLDPDDFLPEAKTRRNSWTLCAKAQPSGRMR